jgi:hypothetical protein
MGYKSLLGKCYDHQHTISPDFPRFADGRVVWLNRQGAVTATSNVPRAILTPNNETNVVAMGRPLTLEPSYKIPHIQL